MDGLRRRRGQEVDDGFVIDFDVGTSEKVFAGRVLDVGEDIFHCSGDDTRLIIVSRLKIEEVSTILHLCRKGTDGAHQGEGLSGRGLPIGKHDRIVTFHSGDYVIPGDLVVNGFILRSGDEFIEVELWRSSA